MDTLDISMELPSLFVGCSGDDVVVDIAVSIVSSNIAATAALLVDGSSVAVVAVLFAAGAWRFL